MAPGQSIKPIDSPKHNGFDSEHIKTFEITFRSRPITCSDKFEFNLSLNWKVLSVDVTDDPLEKQYWKYPKMKLERNGSL